MAAVAPARPHLEVVPLPNTDPGHEERPGATTCGRCRRIFGRHPSSLSDFSDEVSIRWLRPPYRRNAPSRVRSGGLRPVVSATGPDSASVSEPVGPTR